MKRRKKIEYVHEGRYVAEVEVELLEDETGWSPYLSVEDAYKLDDVRDAIRQGDLKAAARYGRIYELRPLHIVNSTTNCPADAKTARLMTTVKEKTRR